MQVNNLLKELYKKQFNSIKCLKFLIRDHYNNLYYKKSVVIREQKLDFKPDDMINLFNVLLEVFPPLS